MTWNLQRSRASSSWEELTVVGLVAFVLAGVLIWRRRHLRGRVIQAKRKISIPFDLMESAYELLPDCRYRSVMGGTVIRAARSFFAALVEKAVHLVSPVYGPPKAIVEPTGPTGRD